jgi:heat shock protein HslJ
MKLLKITTVIISLLFIASCEKDAVTQDSINCLEISQNDGPDKNLQNNWVLLGYSDGSNHCVPDSLPEINISFSDSNNFYGHGSCNTMFGDYNTSGTDTIKITDLIHSLRDCLDDSINTWEYTFFTTLSAASNYTIEGKLLTIESANGKNLVFVSN